MSSSKFAEVLDAAKEMGFDIPAQKLPLAPIVDSNAREVAPGVFLHTLSKDDPDGTIGLREDGSLGIREDVEVGENIIPTIKWISDCVIFITEERVSAKTTEFTIRGVGAKDQRQVQLTVKAEDLAIGRYFKGQMIRVFGALNKFGKMDWECLQTVTLKAGKVRIIKLIEVPCWQGNTPMIPGAVLRDDVQFKLAQLVHAKVYDGDLEEAKDVLRDVLSSCKYAPILVTHVLGSPAVARWMPEERIGVALWALTGNLKTTFAQICMTVYGTGYLSDLSLVKAGGNTDKAEEIKIVSVGILPVIYDNVKTVDPKAVIKYVALIQMIIEGADRGRGTVDAKIRDALAYLTSPIITGEVRPEEASTDARILNLTWVRPDMELVNQVLEDILLMPVLGYHWLKFLSTTQEDIIEAFKETRAKQERAFAVKGMINPGRLASIYASLRTVYDLLLKSPLGDVFAEFEEDFKAALDEAIDVQGDIVNNDTESSKFLNALAGLRASQPQLFQAATVEGSIDGKIIGKHAKEGLFLLPELVLEEMNRLHVFTQKPTVDSMTKALYSAGILVPDKDGKHLQARKSINGHQTRGWLLRPSDDKTTGETQKATLDKPSGLGKRDMHQPQQPTKPTKTTEEAKTFFPGKGVDDQTLDGGYKKSSGLSGLSGLNKAIDNDFDKPTNKTTPRPVVGKDAVAWVQMLCRHEGYESGQRAKLDEAKAREWEAAKICVITGEVTS
jgi:hypothetical protein